MADQYKPEVMKKGGATAQFYEDNELPEMRPPEELMSMDDAQALQDTSAASNAVAMPEEAPSKGQVESPEPDPSERYPEMEPLPTKSGSLPQSEATAADFAATPDGDAYLRLVVQVTNGKMAVTDASVVDGPLVNQPDLTGEMAYQVSIDGTRVGSEAFADLQKIHSLAPPDNPELGHHHGILNSFDFVVRVPREDISLEELDRLHIELFRMRETTELSQMIDPASGVTFDAAAASRSLETPPAVAELVGVNLDSLPTAAASAIRNGLR